MENEVLYFPVNIKHKIAKTFLVQDNKRVSMDIKWVKA